MAKTKPFKDKRNRTRNEEKDVKQDVKLVEENEESTEIEVNQNENVNNETTETNEVIEKNNVEKEVEEVEINKVKKLTAKAVSEALKNMTVDEAIEFGIQHPELKDIAEMLKRYKTYFNQRDADNGARLNFMFYNTIINILNDADFSRVSVRYRYLINIICKGKSGIFSEFNLQRFDYKWSWGKDSLLQHSSLVAIMHYACTNGVKNISGVVDSRKLGRIFNDVVASNLKKLHF